MSETPFIRNRRIFADFLSLCHQFYEGAMGTNGLPTAQSRMARDPLDLAMDMADALRETYFRLKAPPGRLDEGRV